MKETSNVASADRKGWCHSAFARESGLVVVQSNGAAPGIVVSAHAPGEHGISFMQNSLEHGVEGVGTSLHHTIFVTVQTEGQITTSVEGESATFEPTVGTIAIIPAGARCSSMGRGAMSAFILMVPRDTLAFAAAGRARVGATVIERPSGQDMTFLKLGYLLRRQVLEGFVDDPIAWYELTDAVVGRLIDTHMSEVPVRARGRLSAKTLERVIDCIHANIDRPLGVNEIAAAAEQTWSHFPRLFRQSTGMSPYQFVIRVRLQHALRMLRHSRLPLAEVALRSGFADQSHLCRWMRRSYGASPGQFLA